MRPRSRLVATLAAALAPAAALRAQPPAEPDPLAAVAFARSLGVDLAHSVRLPSGVYRRDLEAGRGDSVRTWAQVTLRLRVWRPDGVAITDVGPETRPWAPGRYAPAVEAGLRGMRAGGRRQLVLPATSADGNAVMPGAPR